MYASIQGLLKSCEDAAKKILKHVEQDHNSLILSHNDADGIAAGAIMAKAISRLGGRFHLRVLKQLDEETVEQIKHIKTDVYIFAEIGSGYLDLVSKIEAAPVLVLDHHKPLDGDYPELTHVNPHIHCIDGTTELSGAGVCYLTAKKLSQENTDLSPLAIVGALGDLQDKNQARSLQGLNEEIAIDGVKAGLLKVSRDLLLYGRETRPLHKALASTMNPFIPGLGGEEDRCLGFLTNLGIPLKKDDCWRTVSDLSLEEKQRIFSQLTIHLVSKGFSEASILQMTGSIYTLVKEDERTPLRDGREYASLLNSCSKMDKTGLAVSICLEARGEALEEAQGCLNQYRKSLAGYITSLLDAPERIKKTESLYLIEGQGIVDENFISPIASILSTSGGFGSSRPLLALTLTRDGQLKASARASRELVERGLNLGTVMQRAAEQLDGRGGGHNVAAGATLRADRKEEFIALVSQLSKQMVDVDQV